MDWLWLLWRWGCLDVRFGFGFEWFGIWVSLFFECRLLLIVYVRYWIGEILGVLIGDEVVLFLGGLGWRFLFLFSFLFWIVLVLVEACLNHGWSFLDLVFFVLVRCCLVVFLWKVFCIRLLFDSVFDSLLTFIGFGVLIIDCLIEVRISHLSVFIIILLSYCSLFLRFSFIIWVVLFFLFGNLFLKLIILLCGWIRNVHLFGHLSF